MSERLGGDDLDRHIVGPMLRHGLQGFQGLSIRAPRQAALRPDRELLAERYELFRRAG